MNTSQLKTILLEHCKAFTENRFEKVKNTITSIEESLFDQSKSSAGDKHETGRAMLQIDRENAGRQLHEIEKLQEILKKVDVTKSSKNISLGSLVETDMVTYFISISAGNVTLNKTQYCCVALQAPIGQLLFGKKEGDSLIFNGKVIGIKSVN
ncbi:3-oxoacyl-ACP synthase [Patiriisocius hiemis]|uniref:3-oxoacyl-ACP synthase n=1 Tax=Patiriisocius hiemis TaxID=3075604 RepID=A0ABU2YCZ5_9FLAO|nr:3-oxoacyl-ACP synthase [Constantimarinum sp. W242]MDT0555632.1 3-oxoacyl-ACP synthase [Constantimarinum sp. W242]